MLKKFAMTASLISCLITIPCAHAADRCFDLSLDVGNGPNLLRPTTPEECSDVISTLKASGRYPNIFTRQGNNIYPSLCFISNSSDPSSYTSGIHATLGGKSVTINSQSVWTNEFTPFLPFPPFNLTGTDNLAGIVTRWAIRENGTNKLIGKVFTTDTLDTSRLATLGQADELDVFIAGTDQLTGAKGSVKLSSQINAQGLPEITDLTGKICLPQ